MIKLVTDSSTLYSQAQAKEKGITSCPLAVSINGKSYREFEEISSEELVNKINEGGIPSTSQPSIGEKMEAYDALAKDNEVIDICMADGLSGTYQSAHTAKEASPYSENISVFNTRTLCGPHRLMVDTANEMAQNGASKDEILTMLEKTADTEMSFLMPYDFSFLKRGGRLHSLAAGLGGLLKLNIALTKTEDGKLLIKFAVTKTLKKIISLIFEEFDKKGVDDTYRFYVTHAFNEKVANEFVKAIKNKYPNAIVEEYTLSPAFITQGGPLCVAVQTVKVIK